MTRANFFWTIVVCLLLSGCVSPSNTGRLLDDSIEETSTPIINTTIKASLGYPAITPDPPIPYPDQEPYTSYSSLYPVFTPTFGFNPTITPTFIPDDSLEPYTGKPFSIVVFGRELWLIEIGGKNKRQLTYEPEGWYIARIAINRQGNRLAYIALKMNHEITDGMIKLLDLRTGDVRPLVGMGDGVIEYQLKWLDDTHLAYSYEEFSKYHIQTPVVPTPFGGYHPYEYFIFDLETGRTNYTPNTIDISQSPDGRFRLICKRIDPISAGCEFNLNDLLNDQTWTIAEASEWGLFEGWSSDSQWMLFRNLTFSKSETDHKYLIVNPVTLAKKWADPPNYCSSISWAFQSAEIACAVGDNENGAQIQFWGTDGIQTKPPIRLPMQFNILSWTPDDTRLIIYPEEHTLWAIKLDGSGLQQIFYNIGHWVVLPNSGK